MRRAGAEARPKHRSSGSGNRRRGKSIWTSRLGSTRLKSSTKLPKRSFLLDRERPVFFSLVREKKMGGSNLDQPLQMAIIRPRQRRDILLFGKGDSLFCFVFGKNKNPNSLLYRSEGAGDTRLTPFVIMSRFIPERLPFTARCGRRSRSLMPLSTK